MSSILVGNIPTKFQIPIIQYESTGEKVSFYSGYKIGKDSKLTFRIIKEKILISLLIYDLLYIYLDDILMLIKLFGEKDFFTLMKKNCFKIIDDKGFKSVIRKDNNENKIHYIYIVQDDIMKKIKKSILDNFDNKLTQNEIKLLLFYIERNSVSIDTYDSSFIETFNKELEFDMSNKLFLSFYNISTTSLSNINKYDILKINRLADLNKHLILGKNLKLNTSILDGEVKNLWI